MSRITTFTAQFPTIRGGYKRTTPSGRLGTTSQNDKGPERRGVTGEGAGAGGGGSGGERQLRVRRSPRAALQRRPSSAIHVSLSTARALPRVTVSSVQLGRPASQRPGWLGGDWRYIMCVQYCTSPGLSKRAGLRRPLHSIRGAIPLTGRSFTAVATHRTWFGVNVVILPHCTNPGLHAASALIAGQLSPCQLCQQFTWHFTRSGNVHQLAE